MHAARVLSTSGKVSKYVHGIQYYTVLRYSTAVEGGNREAEMAKIVELQVFWARAVDVLYYSTGGVCWPRR